jgi:hypothetical protein
MLEANALTGGGGVGVTGKWVRASTKQVCCGADAQAGGERVHTWGWMSVQVPRIPHISLDNPVHHW